MVIIAKAFHARSASDGSPFDNTRRLAKSAACSSQRDIFFRKSLMVLIGSPMRCASTKPSTPAVVLVKTELTGREEISTFAVVPRYPKQGTESTVQEQTSCRL